MRDVGYDLTRHRSKGLAELPKPDFDLVVTMGCGDVSGWVRGRRFEAWDVPAPKDMPADEFRAVRDRIEEKVKDLLAGLGIPCREARLASVGGFD
jgi:protein-tyrosine-phosphatase